MEKSTAQAFDESSNNDCIIIQDGILGLSGWNDAFPKVCYILDSLDIKKLQNYEEFITETEGKKYFDLVGYYGKHYNTDNILSDCAGITDGFYNFRKSRGETPFAVVCLNKRFYLDEENPSIIEKRDKEFLEQQLKAIAPDIVVAVGAYKVLKKNGFLSEEEYNKHYKIVVKAENKYFNSLVSKITCLRNHPYVYSISKTSMRYAGSLLYIFVYIFRNQCQYVRGFADKLQASGCFEYGDDKSILKSYINAENQQENELNYKYGIGYEFKDNVLIRYCGNQQHIFLEDGIILGDNAFCNNKYIKSIMLPDDLKVVTGFSQCSNLEKIIMPSKAERIEHLAFYDCKKLKEISIPDGVRFIGESAFAYCQSIEAIHLPDSVTTVLREAFSDCSSLQLIKLSQNIRVIEDYTFSKCNELEFVDNRPLKVQSIGKRAFFECSSLWHTHISDTVINIGKDAFCDCINLIIVAPENSYVEQYARKHRIPFVIEGESEED